MGKRAGSKSEGGADAGPSRPFDEMVGEWVGKVVPERWQPTALAGTAILAFLLFILMIIFARDPEEAAKAEIKELKTRVETLEKDLAEASSGKGKSAREATNAAAELERANKRVARLEEDRKKLDARAQESRKQLEEALVKSRQLESQLRAAKGGAARDKKTVERDMARAVRDRDAFSKSLEELKTQLAESKKQYEGLRGKQEQETALYEKAKAAYQRILDTVAEIEDPEKKIEAIKKLRTASRQDLVGTVYTGRLDDMVKQERGRLEKAKRVAQKKAKREAKDAYTDYTNRLKTAADHEAAMALLTEAKKEFEDLGETGYLAKIDGLMKSREAKHADDVARKVHDDVMRKVASQPTKYEEDLGLLEEALQKTKGTRYAAAIQKQVDSRRRTLPDDVARVLYRELVSRSRKNPDKHDENIAFAEEMKPRITARYEKHFAKQLGALKAAKLESVGRKALSEAQEHVAKNPTEHKGNIDKLIELKKLAGGSRYEKKLQGMLERERKLLLRSGK